MSTTTTARTELDKFLEAMDDIDVETAATFLADDITLRSPIVPQPFSGKETVTAILGYISTVTDEFDSLEVLTGPENSRSSCTSAPARLRSTVSTTCTSTKRARSTP